MNTNHSLRTSGRAGSALLVTMVLMSVAMITVASYLAYSTSTTQLDYRANQYQRAVSAAEGVSEKVTAQISRDFLNGDEALVNGNLPTYRQTTLSASDSPDWSDWEFSDAMGHVGQTFVTAGAPSGYIVLSSVYAGLQGFGTTYTIISNARQTDSPVNVEAGVFQQLQLGHIPVFQFAMYSSGDMEIGNGQPFTITGRVHSNGQLYVEPISPLTFQSDVTAVGDILYQRSPLDPRAPPYGSVVYEGHKDSHVAAMVLPIGVTNTPAAVREIIEPPAPLESASSPIGRLRYFNRADLLLVASNSASGTVITGSSGNSDNFMTAVPTNELNSFVTATNSFFDAREGKTVWPIDINVAALTSWSATNSNLRRVLNSNAVASIYVWDRRSLTGANLAAVRVTQGNQLPARGLTVATGDPLYVWGHYNQPDAGSLGTTNTSNALPASLVGDAITILSPNWTDANSTAAVASRVAVPTTVNAAIIAGAVDTVQGYYSGGMENFPRFLETWGANNVFTYNGSMVKLFPSLYATNLYGQPNVYSPPARNWAYDQNFNNPTKLPPLTPSVLKVIRAFWASIGPNQTNAPASF